MISRADEAGYGKLAVGFGERPALVVVDFQAAFLQSEYPLGGFEAVSRACEQTEKLLNFARSCRIPVACCYIAYDTPSDIPRWKIPSLYSDFFEGSAGTVLDRRIVDRSYDYVFSKKAPSAFFGTPLHSHLQSLRIDTVAIAGCVTSGCIRATAVDSFSHGYRTIVLDDCCGDPEQERHLASIRDLTMRYVDVATSQDFRKQVEERMTAMPEQNGGLE